MGTVTKPSVLEAAAELCRTGRRGAMVTIIETTGSTPRKAGAKMLVDDAGKITGTIGGGCVEADLYSSARNVMRSGRVEIHEVDLSVRNRDENDMLCGGRLKVLVEPVGGEETLVIMGGGHISKALCAMSAGLEYRVIVTDDRPEFANESRFPQASQLVAAPFEKQFEQLPVNAGTSIVIVTRGHSHDEICMANALRTPARYIGLVGSRTKVAVFRKNLREQGFTDTDLDRVQCPCGLDIGAQTPEEIAVSIMGQLIAVRRGKA